MTHKPSIIAIDPGYDRVGWAVGTRHSVYQIDILDCGCIQTDKTAKLSSRYKQISQDLSSILEKHKPTQAAIESLFFFKNHKTALKVAEARGVVISSFLKKDLELFEYTPLQIKQAVTGHGRADKKAVEKMIRLQFKLDDKPLIDDTVDALAILLTHAASLGTPF